MIEEHLYEVEHAIHEFCSSTILEWRWRWAQVAHQSGHADAARVINNLNIAQGKKDTPCLIDVTGSGHPKECSGKEEDSQQLSKKTETLFTGVVQGSEMMLEWTAEQAAEITAELIVPKFLPSSTNQERGLQNLEFVLQHVHGALMALTSYKANDTGPVRMGDQIKQEMEDIETVASVFLTMELGSFKVAMTMVCVDFWMEDCLEHTG